MNGQVRAWFRGMRSPSLTLEVDRFLAHGNDGLGYARLNLPGQGEILWMNPTGLALYQKERRLIARYYGDLERSPAAALSSRSPIYYSGLVN